ncbi:BnaC06g14340D [Brassica napus]|uniref:BnaC06g14340D protein n=1 Tax=Brassica napus TaxID=3708 RepID=A0A078FLY8_BRANA|nr:BnaC06g14340D [Brassica napus]
MLEEYFNDEEMMVIHRVHLEMKKAKLDLENQRCYQLVHGNEIIVIDDTDSDSDRTERLESNKLSITVFNTDVALDSEYIPQPNVSNDNLLNTQPIYDNPVVSEGVLDDAIVIYNGETMPQNSANVDFIPATNNSPSISATVGLIPNPANADDNLVINLDDSSSEDSMHSGVF